MIAAKASKDDVNTSTTTPVPVDPTEQVPTEGGIRISITLLGAIVAIYWAFVLLYCCCRVVQGNQRNYHNLDADCCLCSVECLECCAQCSEDCGKGQFIKLDGTGMELFY